MKRLIAVIFILSIFIGCGYGNVDNVKHNAEQTWGNVGYVIYGYEGYKMSPGIPFTNYGLGDVWYIVRKKQDNNVLYNGYLYRWGNEYHIYSLRAIDAIKTGGK